MAALGVSFRGDPVLKSRDSKNTQKTTAEKREKCGIPVTEGKEPMKSGTGLGRSSRSWRQGGVRASEGSMALFWVNTTLRVRTCNWSYRGSKAKQGFWEEEIALSGEAAKILAKTIPEGEGCGVTNWEFLEKPHQSPPQNQNRPPREERPISGGKGGAKAKIGTRRANQIRDIFFTTRQKHNSPRAVKGNAESSREKLTLGPND